MLEYVFDKARDNPRKAGSLSGIYINTRSMGRDG